MTSESETLLSKTITYSVSFRDFQFLQGYMARRIFAKNRQKYWHRIECDALSSRRIVRHKPPLSAVFLSVGHSVLGGSDRMPDPCDQAPLEYVPNAGI